MVFGVADLDAVEGLAVGGVGLTTDVVADAGGGHEVALVGAVDEHGTGEGAAGFHGDGEDLGAVFFDAGLAVEALAFDDGNLVRDFGEHGVVDLGSGVGFEGPHGVFGAGVAVRFAGEVSVAGFLLPLGGVGVELEDGGVELAGDAADGFFIADVGGAESAGGEAAEELGGFNEDGGAAHAGGLDGGGDACGGAAVDDDVEGVGGGEGGGGEEGEEQEGAHGDEGKERVQYGSRGDDFLMKWRLRRFLKEKMELEVINGVEWG